MSHRWLVSLSVTLGLLILLWAIGSALAQEPEPKADLSAAATVNSRISYQGVLTEGGTPVNGNRNMVFDFYANNSCSGIAVLQVIKNNVPVTNGLFSVELDVTHGVFWGQGLWLEVEVDGTSIGCKEILPVPYALSLRPGAEIAGEPTAWDGWVLRVNMDGTYATGKAVLGSTATGSAVYGESASGYGVSGHSDNGYAVRGVDAGTETARGYGGYFTSNNGVGVYGYSGADRTVSNNYAPGVYGRSANGVGVYGVSEGTQAGLHGESAEGYGGYFYSSNYRGLRASSASDFYAGYFVNRGGSGWPGLYVDGTLYTTGAKTGYVVDICFNEGPGLLETGDVVVVTGFGESVVGEIPVIRVHKATEAESTGVVGVVDQPYTLEASPDDEGRSVPKPVGGAARIASGTAISPGKYLSVVTLGSFKAIKVDASYGDIQPGDLLVSSPNPGYAMRVEDPRVGTVIGKALGELVEGTGVMPVLITLH